MASSLHRIEDAEAVPLAQHDHLEPTEDVRSQQRCRGRVVAGALSVGLLVGVGATVVADQGALLTGVFHPGSKTSITGSIIQKDTGCSNWYQMLLEPISNYSRYSVEQHANVCFERCKNTPGCSSFGFQKSENCLRPLTQAVALQACYLYSAAARCAQEKNTCWDHYTMDSVNSVPWTKVKGGTGCKLEGADTAGDVAVGNPDACGKLCITKKGCTHFAYKTAAHAQIKATCLLLADDSTCKEAGKDWELYKLHLPLPTPTPSPSATKTWTLATDGEGIGCTNWASAKIASVSFEHHPDLCGKRCSRTSGCRGFGWQKLPTTNPKDGFASGACYMFDAPCDRVKNAIWDLYVMMPANTLHPTPAPPAPVATPAPTLHPGRAYQMSVYCPQVADMQVHEGTGTTLQNQGWTIQGEGRVSTNALFDFRGGWVSYTVDMSGVKTGAGAADGDAIYARNFLLFPIGGTGSYNGSAGICHGKGTTRSDFCPHIVMSETNGKSAYGVSYHLHSDVPTGSHAAAGKECHTSSTDSSSNCRAERYFTTAAPEACTGAAGQTTKINSALPFSVNTTFSMTGDVTMTFSQTTGGTTNEDVITMNDLTKALSSVSKATVEYTLRTHGGGVAGELTTSDWAPGTGCPTAAADLATSKLVLSDLKIHASIVRGKSVLCESR